MRSSTAGAIDSGRQAKSRALDRDLGAATWFAALLLGGGLSLLLTYRRIVGALVEPPSAAALVAAAVGLAIAAVFMRRAAPLLNGRELNLVLPGVVAILLLAAVTLPGTPALGVALAWFVLIGSQAMGWLSPQIARRRRVESLAALAEPEIAEGLQQQVTRVREGDRESIHAFVRAEVPAGDRLAIVHIAFCPPLAARPALTAHAMDEQEAEVKLTKAETFGMRIDVRLPRVKDQARCVLVEVIGVVTCPPNS